MPIPSVDASSGFISSPGARGAVAAAYKELDRIEALMSEWRPDSPISQGDAAAGQHAVEVPAELRELIERSSARLTEAGVSFGHGTTNAFDEAAWLVLWSLDLPLDALDEVAEQPVPPDEAAKAAELVERRIQRIADDSNIRLIEQPEYKRRWNTEPWDEQLEKALEKWLLDRIERSTEAGPYEIAIGQWRSFTSMREAYRRVQGLLTAFPLPPAMMKLFRK